MAEKFNVVVIGSGPGGYVAAIRCAQKGVSVALIEKSKMGGTCLNRGCIPSKALLGSAHLLVAAKHAKLMGVDISGEITPNWEKMQARKDGIVSGFSKGVGGLLKANGVKVFQGKGIVTAAGTISIDGETEIKAKNIILATGSVPIEIPVFPFDGETIISSKEALTLKAIPESMVIIGGGVIGCEMACVYASVGCKVTIVEALDSLLPNEDAWVGKLLTREFKKLGIVTKSGTKVTAVDVAGGKATVSIEGADAIEAEKVLVAVGRRAACDKATVESLELEMNGAVIKVNKKMRTSAAGVYAIGDVVGTTYLAHGAFMEADVAADNITGSDNEMSDYKLVPRAVYTFPEVCSVGLSEKDCEKAGIEVKVGKAMFRSNGRSVAHNDIAGEVRVLRDKSNDKIIGVTMVGATVTEMVSTARALIGSNEEISDVCFAHPTVSEVLKEAWEDAFGLSCHVPPKRKH